jgi:hypothetical protein
MAVKGFRKEAMFRDCQIRLSPQCTGDYAVVLCHYRLMDVSGFGLKSPDWLGAWGCAHCHAIVDSDHSDAVQLQFAHAVFHTIHQLTREGKLKWD